MKNSIHELSPDALLAWMKAHAQPTFRAGQLRQWILKPGVTEFSQMANLPKTLREMLDAEFFARGVRVVCRQGKPRESAEKFLLELQDGNRVEMVLLHNKKGEHTLCVSTQVGCAMGCAFCASGLGGVVRNLTAGEILEQFLLAADHISETHMEADTAPRLSHAVIMGMGEPMMNLENLLTALETVSAEDGLGIGARKITISTVGIPAGIRKLAETDRAYHLAVSLHAPEDTLRDELMPTNRGTGLRAIMEAADFYFQKTGRRVTYEYILLSGVNDAPAHAKKLAALLRGQNALVNLIPYNRVEGLPFQPPSEERVAHFAADLQQHGIPCVLRHRKGEKLDAACGQLRRRVETEETTAGNGAPAE